MIKPLDKTAKTGMLREHKRDESMGTAKKPQKVLERIKDADALEKALRTDKPVVALAGPNAVDALFDWLDD